MTDAAPRRAATRICTAALWDNCRCPKCKPDSSGAHFPAPDDAATCTNDPAGGGTYPPPSDALANASPGKAAAPTLAPSPTGGGLFDQEFEA